MTKSPKPYEFSGYVILNPYGDVWSPKLFDRPEEARDYLDRFWKDGTKVHDFKVVPGYTMTYVSSLSPTPETEG